MGSVTENRVSTTAAFRQDFDTVAEYYEMEKAGDMETFKDMTRERLRNNSEAVVAEFAKNAAWMSLCKPVIKSEGVSGPFLNGFEFCVAKDDK